MCEMDEWITRLKEMEKNHLPDLDHKDCGIIAELLEDSRKAVRFVNHIQNHLNEYKEHGIHLEHYKVMCKICNKTIEEIE